MHKTLLISMLTLSISTTALADDLLQTLNADGSFKTLVSAIKTAGLEDKFKAAGPITVFAPNDEAFAKLPKAKLKKLLADKAELAKVLSYHIVPATISKADVDAGKVKTLEGDDLSLSVTDGVKVNHVAVKGQEIHADNGAIHVVEAVLIPKK